MPRGGCRPLLDSNPREGVIRAKSPFVEASKLDSNPREGVIPSEQRIKQICKERFKPP